MNLSEHEAANRKWWDEVTPNHVENYGNYFVGVDEFLNGKTTLPQVQLDELGDINGKSLLHLQCHFGLDSLSLVCEGAEVTAVDFSPKSIEAARKLTDQSGLKAKFIEANVFDLPEIIADEKFDIVYTTQGVLTWLKDIDRWAEIVAMFLKPDGMFYVQELHPIFYTLEGFKDNLLDVRYPYFGTGDAVEWPEDESDYADGEFKISTGSADWPWSMGQIITALANAGLRIEFLHEFDYVFYKGMDNMERIPEGWVIPTLRGKVPLSFTIKAWNS